MVQTFPTCASSLGGIPQSLHVNKSQSNNMKPWTFLINDINDHPSLDSLPNSIAFSIRVKESGVSDKFQEASFAYFK